MKKNNTIPLGIIEGFFGRSWDHNIRAAYVKFLAQHQFDFYIYAPKNDSYLRRQWHKDWPADEKNSLMNLRDIYANEGIQFGVGLSPLEIWQEQRDPNYRTYRNRIQQLNDLNPDILCILFDDMRGDLPELAAIQTDLTHIAADLTCARQIIFCPSYYSTDPVLEKVFGKMPDNYWQDLGKGIDPAIDIFWTGTKVCSEFYSADDLQWIAAQLQRKVFLWDNYPVNDGAIKSRRLHLQAFHPSHAELAPHLSGHAANPMNQAWLSQIPLLSLVNLYQQTQFSPEDAFVQIAGELLGRQLFQDAAIFQHSGLNQLSIDQKNSYKQIYQQFLPNPFAREVMDWLDDLYLFDPSCLTE